MERGRDFLRTQVNNTVHQHRTLIENIKDHEKQAEDSRYRELCARWLPRLQEHQRMLEEYQESLGEAGKGGVKNALGSVLGKARDAVDAMRESDFLRVVGDIVTIRQSQDTFATFAAVGEQIGEPRLAEIGRTGEREHDEMQREFNELVRALFIDHVREGETGVREAAD